MQRHFTAFHASVAVHVEVQGETLELRAFVAGAVGHMQSLKKHLDRETREDSSTLLAYDALADAVICRRSTTLSTVPLEGTVALFAREVIRFRHLLEAKEPATPNRETVKKRLLDAYHGARAKGAESLLLRADAAAPQAADFLNAVNAILFDARHELAPDGDELGALKALLCDMDLCMGAEPAGLVIRNAIAIQTEIMACRASLPAQWTLAHHDLDVWRLFVDGDAWTSDLGKYHFDNELGYMAGCLRAFRYLMSTRGQRLDARMLAKAHDVAVEAAFKRMPTPLVHRFQLGYRSQSVAFALIEGRNCSAEGLREFFSRVEAGNGWISVTPASQSMQGQLTVAARTAEECQEKADSILSEYYAKLSEAGSDASNCGNDSRSLHAIARCCQALDQHHVFMDANIRTIGFLCLNKLLIDADLAPAVLVYPKVLDMCSMSEIVTAIEHGQLRFRSLRERGTFGRDADAHPVPVESLMELE